MEEPTVELQSMEIQENVGKPESRPIQRATGNNNNETRRESTDSRKWKIENTNDFEEEIGDNNLIFPKEEQPVTESIGLEFLLDDIVITEKSEVYGQDVEFEDANNEESDKNKVRPAEADLYPKIKECEPTPMRINSLKCSEVRWFRKGKRPIPFSNDDSLKMEIKYRRKNGIELDEEADRIYNRYLKHLDMPLVTLSKTGTKDKSATISRESSMSSEGETTDPSKTALLVDGGYYRVSKKNRFIHPIYWKNDSIEIIRGYYFTSDSQPINEKETNEINNHLDKFFAGIDSAPKDLEMGTTIIQFSSVTEIQIVRKGKRPNILRSYSMPALWTGGKSEVENLVFVIHGVGHNNKEDSIVKGVKQLIEGVAGENKDLSNTMFLPIHWRTNLEDDHVCNKNCVDGSYDGKLNRILNDLKLYNCGFYGSKIRKIVFEKIKTLFTSFKSKNPNFNGTVSFFGHSLGSVIFYDILTMDSLEEDRKKFEFEKVHQLFVVGSPLWYFLGKRGESAREQFRKAANTFRIFNIYHNGDIVAGRIEHIAHSKYKNTPSIEIPNDLKSTSCGIAMITERTVNNLKKIAEKRVGYSMEGETDFLFRFRVDYQLESKNTVDELQPHSIYWDHPSFTEFLRCIFSSGEHCGRRRTITEGSCVQNG